MNQARPLFCTLNLRRRRRRLSLLYVCYFFVMSFMLLRVFLHSVILIVYKRCARFTGNQRHTMHQAFCNFIFGRFVCAQRISFFLEYIPLLIWMAVCTFVWSAQQNKWTIRAYICTKKATKEKEQYTHDNEKVTFAKELQRNCDYKTRKYII